MGSPAFGQRARLFPASLPATASDPSPPTAPTNDSMAPSAPAVPRQSLAAGASSFHVPQDAANAVVASVPSSSAPSAAGDRAGGDASSAVLAVAAPKVTIRACF